MNFLSNAKDFSGLAGNRRSEERNVRMYLSTGARAGDAAKVEKDKHMGN